jgi:hypothetical protein
VLSRPLPALLLLMMMMLMMMIVMMMMMIVMMMMMIVMMMMLVQPASLSSSLHRHLFYYDFLTGKAKTYPPLITLLLHSHRPLPLPLLLKSDPSEPGHQTPITLPYFL